MADLDEGQAERVGEACLAGRRHPYRAGAVQPIDPAELEGPRGERGAEFPGRVGTALAPVEARAEERAAARDRVEVDAEPRERLEARVGDVLVGHDAALEGRVQQRRPEPAGEVVVAGARLAESVGPSRLAQRADRLVWRDAGERLERLRDLRPCSLK
jgi:hypothetical protein